VPACAGLHGYYEALWRVFSLPALQTVWAVWLLNYSFSKDTE